MEVCPIKTNKRVKLITHHLPNLFKALLDKLQLHKITLQQFRMRNHSSFCSYFFFVFTFGHKSI